MPMLGRSVALAILLVAAVYPLARAESEVDFGRDVYAVLQRSCFECHGAKKVEGGLRLDERTALFHGGDSGPALLRGQAEKSDLVRRIGLPKGDSEAMPARGDMLSAKEIDALKRWINAGAVWPENFQPPQHWAYVAPVRPRLPAVKNAAWPRNAVDRFVLARLEQAGLAPAPEADRYTLARRLYLDLIGLPPTVAEVDAFVNDASPDAYERLVDRLLASEQFGVRWGRPWLDYARYADSHGYQKDDFRDLWAYRDWVIDAFNRDMPFAQFTVEQIAGDLLPGATESQKVATGFNRCSPTNVEAGSDPEETRTSQVIDRVNTLGTVWLGTTLACAQCHDHKYDPFTQKDYYGLYAIFNSTTLEAERSNPKVPGSIKFRGPAMPLKSMVPEIDRAAVEEQLRKVNAQIAVRTKELGQVDADWERRTLAGAGAKGEEAQAEVLALDDFTSKEGATVEGLPDHSVLVSGEIPDKDVYTFAANATLTTINAFRLDALTDDALPGNGPGLGDAEHPNFVLQDFSVSVVLPGKSAPQPLKFSGARADFSQKDFDVASAVDASMDTGWAIAPQFGKPHWAVFELAEPLKLPAGAELKFKLVQGFGKARCIGRLKVSALAGKGEYTAVPRGVRNALQKAAAKRNEAERQAVVRFRESQDARYQELVGQRDELTRSLKTKAAPTTLVMQELPKMRESFVLQRGNFLTPGDAVAPHTPAVLHKLAAARAAPNRLDLARWLVSPENPLVNRVTVNRLWAEVFGRGLVSTPEDFGVKGALPTHPELLDWLAVEFRDRGGLVKELLRTLVLSSTYRQSSRVTPELHERDDQNLLLARGPRFRLPAESIRDNALAIAGLISLAQGGPAVRPYQPEGIWLKVGGEKYDYEMSPGEMRYRRGVYVVWKRGAPYPSFVNFDADNRMACRVKRSRSNTPLQALTLMNDPVYVEAAKALAVQMLSDSGKSTLEQRLTEAFRRAEARPPEAKELAGLARLYQAQHAAAQSDPHQAAELAKRVLLPPGAAVADFAAWYAVSTALLNLDETITKE